MKWTVLDGHLSFWGGYSHFFPGVFVHDTAPGNLVARFVNDITLLRGAIVQSLAGFGKDAFTALALIAVMFHEDWILAAVALFAFPSAIWPIVRIGQRSELLQEGARRDHNASLALNRFHQQSDYLAIIGCNGFDRGNIVIGSTYEPGYQRLEACLYLTVSGGA